MTEPRRPEGSVPELPFRVLVIADLTGRDEVVPPREVTKDTLAELAERLAPRVTLEVEDRLGGGPKPLRLELAFRAPRAFDPEQVAAEIPPVRELGEARAALTAVVAGKAGAETLDRLAGVPAIARLLQRPSAPPPAAGPAPTATGAGVGRLFDLVDVPGQAGTGGTGGNALDALVRAIGTGGTRAGVDRSTAQRALAEIDALLQSQLAAVLEAPQLTALESAWRGLRFLVDRIDFRTAVRLEVASAPAARVSELLAAASDEERPVSLVLAPYELGPSTADAERAEAWARFGESLQAPVVAGVSPRFFGADAWSGATGGSSVAQLLERPEFVQWRALRAKDTGYWLALVLGRVLARRPHARSAASAYAEVRPSAGAWTSSVWAVGTGIARSFARGGLGLDLTGTRGSGRVTDLPLPDEEGRGGPVEPAMSPERAAGFADAGMIALALHGADTAWLPAAPVVRTPARYPDEAETMAAAQQATLAHSLVAGGLAAFIGALRPHLIGLGEQELKDALERQLAAFLGAGSAVRAAVGADPDRPGRWAVGVRVRPPGTVLGRPLEITLALGLAR